MGGMLGALVGSFVPAGGSFESIATANGNGGTTITFSSIPQTYKHLQVRYTARANSGAGILGAVELNFNGVSGTSYASHRLWGNGLNGNTAGTDSQPSIQNLTIAGGAIASNVYGVGIVDIQDYSSTTRNKTVRCLIGLDQNSGNTSAQILMLSGLFNSTSAITSMTFTLAAGFNSSTVYSLYGIKGN
jgi:hypothetical protein